MRVPRSGPNHPTAVTGEAAGAVINPGSGPAPHVWVYGTAKPVYRGHTADMADQDAPIAVHERPETPGALADIRCPACAARLSIAEGSDRVLLILEHKSGCPELARWLRLAGESQ
jgi:hypothetical protein